MNDGIMVPYDMNGSYGNYFCSATWYNNSGTTVARVGGNSDYGARVGVVFWDLVDPASDSGWSHGASLSLKPLEEAEVVT